MSRISLAQETGLSKMAVGNIVASLISENIVVEMRPQETDSAGRNPMMLDLSPDAPKVIGVYIGRDSCTCMVTDYKLNLHDYQTISLKEETKLTIWEKIQHLCDTAMQKYPLVSGIGVSAIGPVDSETGMILNPPNFFDITNFSVVKWLEDTFHLPVFLNNDMNASALAEKLFGAGKEWENFIYFGISNGIGLGIISDGCLYQNGSGFVGEIGHIGIDPGGAVCACGNKGCLEGYASIPVLKEGISKFTGKLPEVADFTRLMAQPAICGYFADVAEKLVYAFISVIHLLHPAAVIIGHEGVYLPKSFWQDIEKEVNRRILFHGYQSVPFVLSGFFDRSASIGSVCCLLNELFRGNLK